MAEGPLTKADIASIVTSSVNAVTNILSWIIPAGCIWRHVYSFCCFTRRTFQHGPFANFKCFAFRYFRKEVVEAEKTVSEKSYLQLKKWFEEEKSARTKENQACADERKQWADERMKLADERMSWINEMKRWPAERAEIDRQKLLRRNEFKDSSETAAFQATGRINVMKADLKEQYQHLEKELKEGLQRERQAWERERIVWKRERDEMKEGWARERELLVRRGEGKGEN